MFRLLRADFSANAKDPKAQFVLLLFRIAHRARTSERYRVVLLPIVFVYRAIVEVVMGIEIRPRTTIGPGLRIFHGVAIVINDRAVLGKNVTLRHSVTIGSRYDGGACPIIEDDVEFGAGAIVLGGIRIGKGARIGAGAVVLHDVPAGGKAYGNPARIFSAVDRCD